jgi:hypothetical protein
VEISLEEKKMKNIRQHPAKKEPSLGNTNNNKEE